MSNRFCYIVPDTIRFSRSEHHEPFVETIPNDTLDQIIKNYCLGDVPEELQLSVGVTTDIEFYSCIEEVKQWLLAGYHDAVREANDKNCSVIYDSDIILNLIRRVLYSKLNTMVVRYLKIWVGEILLDFLWQYLKASESRSDPSQKYIYIT